MVHDFLTGLFVVAVGGAAVDYGVITRLVSGGEVAMGHGRLRCGIGGSRRVIVPGRAGGLVRGIQVL